MTAKVFDDSPRTIETDELRLCLQKALGAHFGAPVEIVRIAREAWAYQSSFALESVTVEFAQRDPLRLMFKDLGWHGLSDNARRAKRHELFDPLREIGVYERVLSRLPGYGPAYYGMVNDDVRHWLFIEHVPGTELYQFGELAVWEGVARWLARMHAAFQPIIRTIPRLQERLVRHDAAQQELWYERACQCVEKVRGAQAARQLRALARFLPAMAEALAAEPHTLIHGEFYPSNIIVARAQGGCQACAVDWEMAGLASGLFDLAALVAGRWTDEQQHRLALAYFDQRRLLGTASEALGDFLENLDYCRLYTAVRWLGWSDNWSAPESHAHDWLAEAVSVAKRLQQLRPNRTA